MLIFWPCTQKERSKLLQSEAKDSLEWGPVTPNVWSSGCFSFSEWDCLLALLWQNSTWLPPQAGLMFESFPDHASLGGLQAECWIEMMRAVILGPLSSS